MSIKGNPSEQDKCAHTNRSLNFSGDVVCADCLKLLEVRNCTAHVRFAELEDLDLNLELEEFRES